MTATILDHEVDEITIESFDTALPCENTDCDREAKWKLRTTCCKRIWLLCQECLDSVIEDLSGNPAGRIMCYKCHGWTTNGKIIGFVERI
jgi:hypothetical protein